MEILPEAFPLARDLASEVLSLPMGPQLGLDQVQDIVNAAQECLISMSELSSSRGLIKSMLVIGSAQVVNILISIFRMKVLAVLLGPSGVGLLSIYNSLLGMVQQTAGLGMGSSGVREIASSRGDEATLSRVRRVLFAAHLIQGTLAMLAVWLLRERIAIWLFGDAVRATEVGLIGIAILLGLLASAQTALLQGLRKIGDLGRVTVIGAFVGTLAGLAAVWLQGESGLIWFILVQPLAAVLIALHYTRRLPKPIAATPVACRDVGRSGNPWPSSVPPSCWAGWQRRRRCCLCEAVSPKNWGSTLQGISPQRGGSHDLCGLSPWCDGGRLLSPPDRGHPRQGCSGPAHE